MPRLSLEQFRARFPIVARRVYVNSCSQGALSTDVQAAITEWLDSWHQHGSPWDLWVERVEQLRAEFAEAIGASSDEIAIVSSASNGINAIASAMDFRGPRSTVVMGEFEFPTMTHVWLAQQRRGAVIRWVRAREDRLGPQAYAEVVDDTTAIVPLTHVCFRNGHKTDVAAVTSLCRDRGALVLLDDYQHTGTGPLNVRELGVDFMVTGSLKYLIAAPGIAFLYARRELIERFEPTLTGWFGRVNPFAFAIDTLDWPETARRFESGTPGIPSAYAASAGLRLLASVGYDAIATRISGLVSEFVARATAAGFAVRTPTEPERCGPLVVVRSHDAPALVAKLAERGIICSARGDGLRVSFHAYNNEQDVHAVMDALEQNAALVVQHPSARSAQAHRPLRCGTASPPGASSRHSR